jgi:hypothetical protein
LITTLNSIITRLHAENATIYSPNSRPICIPDYFTLSNDYENYNDFPIIDEIAKRASELSSANADYQNSVHRMQILKAQDAEINVSIPKNVFTLERQDVRQAIRALKKNMLSQEAAIYEKARIQITGTSVKQFIIYKNYLALNTFENICKYLPDLKHFMGNWLWEKPVFTRNIGDLRNITSLAVCGGPCLYGTSELSVSLITYSGEEKTIDFHRYFYSAKDTKASSRFWHEGAAENIIFTSHKKGLTPQDFDIFDSLFQTAKLLDVPLLIMLPDSAYLKFFDSMIASLDVESRAILHEKYKRVLNTICDIYLQAIEKFYVYYKPKKFEVFHRRNKNLVDIFHQKRARFCPKIRAVTSNKLKEQSIIDYITMPALPYYIWDQKAVFNFDSVEEAEPMHKCMRCHKDAFRTFPVMTTEKISRDGKTSYYETSLEYKDYIAINELRFPPLY